MRLVVDLLACQTASRLRGIGRYTRSLVREMAVTRQSHHMIALANNSFPDAFEDLRREFSMLLPAGSFLPYHHRDINKDQGENDPYFEPASVLIRHAYEILAPDFMLYPSIFEGWGEKGMVALPDQHFPSALRAVVAYDFIPYIFADRFINRDAYYKKYYLQRLETLKQFDLLLAISESTRQDAIRILDFPPERVVNISAAASPVFQKKEYTTNEIETLFNRIGIQKPFVFYTGNVEYHKNLEMALCAYARLPRDLRQNHQFLLTYSGDEVSFREKIRQMGIEDHEIVITGHISDRDLVALYNTCKLYIFPSLYEGFGLPILEAMACGAPVIASNNSSIPEVMGREDAMFNASSEQDISKALYHALTDDNFRLDLANYGLERAKLFSWEKSARAAWMAMEEALERKHKQRETAIPAPARKSNLKVAYVSPMPPEKTGIADYSADLLPHLSQYIDIDLFVEPGLKETNLATGRKLKTYPWTDLIKRQDEYDTIVYQMGNSSYHRHMFQLMREVPGVVVLHEFYLSHIREYVYSTGYQQNTQGDFISEVGDTHGIFGMVDILQRGLNKAIWDWPVNWNVLKYAQKVVVHSDYLNTMVQKFYHRGWYPQLTVINELHRNEKEISAEERAASRQRLGIAPQSFTFCSFGFVNSTKLPLLILESFARYLASDPQATLVFIGETDKGEYDQRINDLINQLGIAEQVRITGFVSQNMFRDYLAAADAAIQLRINTRGETSRAVLDCMAFGIPTIINSHGSLNDYSETCFIKLEEFPNADMLSVAMTRMRNDENMRKAIGANAKKQIDEFHNPEKVAADYYDVIAQAAKTNYRSLFAPMIEAIANCDGQQEMLQSAASSAAANISLRCRSRILIDVSNISYSDLRTGIQRVVKNLVRGLFALQDPSIFVELVRIQEGKLFRSARFSEKLFDLPEQSLGVERPVTIQPGDTLFMLDTSWNLFDQFGSVFQQVRKAGGRIYTMLYDLIPLKFPEFCTAPTIELFRAWIDKAIYESDEIICISKAVASEVEEYTREHLYHLDHACRVSYIHLGADIPVVQAEAEVRPDVQALVRDQFTPLFLMVGTIEPRKGHSFALDAFEQLWQQGKNVRLCIIGKLGWNVEALEQRIRNHPEAGKHLFFIENASDAEVNQCYATGTALIAPSITEGFGLPIIEAALHQVPVLASDIPVFREVGGNGALYFSLESPDCLAKLVETVAASTREERAELARRIPYLSWKESAEWVLRILEHTQDDSHRK